MKMRQRARVEASRNVLSAWSEYAFRRAFGCTCRTTHRDPHCPVMARRARLAREIAREIAAQEKAGRRPAFEPFLDASGESLIDRLLAGEAFEPLDAGGESA